MASWQACYSRFSAWASDGWSAAQTPTRGGCSLSAPPGHHPCLSEADRQWLLRRHQTPEGGTRLEVEAAIDGDRPGEAQAASVGDRQAIAGGSGETDRLSSTVRDLLAAQGQG